MDTISLAETARTLIKSPGPAHSWLSHVPIVPRSRVRLSDLRGSATLVLLAPAAVARGVGEVLALAALIVAATVAMAVKQARAAQSPRAASGRSLPVPRR